VAEDGAWRPLRLPVFRALWLAVLASNIGTWMQTVGAQWLLVERGSGSAVIALVQTASTLPVLLLALPAGALADSFDRRRLLIAVMAFQATVVAVLAALTFAGEMSSGLLLALTFVLGAGTALTAPTYQALIPDLVPRPQVPAAASLGAVSMNVARAVGPALAGLIVAHVNVAAVFTLNAVSFIAVAVVLLARRTPTGGGGGHPERFLSALRAGGRYVRHSPVMRRLLLRSALFVVPATALWALLPVLASATLGLGAGGYGALLAALGAGAVGGVFVLPPLRARFPVNVLLALACLLFGTAMAVLVLVARPVVAVVALVPAGLAWVAVLSGVTAAIQLFLPVWVRARGLSVYQMTFFGAQAVGGVLWGLVAQRAGVTATFLVAGGLLVLAAATVRLWPLLDTAHLDRSPAVYWREPDLSYAPDLDEGPVIVTVRYTVPVEAEADFGRAMARVRRSRRRTGATRWGLYRSGERPREFVEFYVVGSWDEHLRQHGGRLTGADRDAETEARSYATGEPVVQHLFPAGLAEE
jgi:MFS family permease